MRDFEADGAECGRVDCEREVRVCSAGWKRHNALNRHGGRYGERSHERGDHGDNTFGGLPRVPSLPLPAPATAAMPVEPPPGTYATSAAQSP